MLAAILVALAAAELSVRLLVPQPATMRFKRFVKTLQLYRWHDYVNVMENDPELFWRLAANQKLPEGDWPLRGLISNAEGLREDHEIPLDKPPGELRLLFLGDSCTFGYGLLHREGFVYRLEAKLRAAFPQAHLQCINAGVPGYTLFQGLRFLETRGFRYQPDLVVLNFGWNDGSQWAGAGDLDRYGPRLVCRYAPQLRASRLYQLAWSAIESWTTTHDTAGRPRLLPEEFRSLLGQTEEEARRHGADVLLLSWAARFNVANDGMKNSQTPYQREMLAYGRQLRFGPERAAGVVDFVPVVQELAKKHTPDDVFFDHGHATALANERLAEALAKKLIPWVRERLAEAKQDAK
jgi:lysophospholipase L1-like esterase